LSRDSIPPGQQAAIHVSFHVPISPGTVKHTVTIPTNSFAQPPIELTLYATSWLGVRYEPQTIDAGMLHSGEAIEKYLQLYTPDGKPFSIGHVSTDREDIQVHVERQDMALPVHKLSVRYQAGESLGHTRGTITITTDRLDGAVLRIPLVARIVGNIEVSPSVIEIDSNQRGEVVKKVILIKPKNTDADIAVANVMASAPWDVVTYSKLPAHNGGILIEINLRFPLGDGNTSGALNIDISTPQKVMVCVPLMIRGWTPPSPAS
jgi:hypothetical protein